MSPESHSSELWVENSSGEPFGSREIMLLKMALIFSLPVSRRYLQEPHQSLLFMVESKGFFGLNHEVLLAHGLKATCSWVNPKCLMVSSPPLQEDLQETMMFPIQPRCLLFSSSVKSNSMII